MAACFVIAVLSCSIPAADAMRRTHGGSYISAIGDPGMRRDGLRVAWEAWNFCNEVGEEAPGMGSPRGADCFDLETSVDEHGEPVYEVAHKVTDADNRLRAGDPFPGTAASNATVTDVDLYAAAKEVYLGELCQVADDPSSSPWQFWMVMLKNGNLDTTAAICPENGRPARPFPQTSRFPCPGGAGCMNQPLVFHNRTALDGTGRWLRGGVLGTYELDAAAAETDLGSRDDVSYYEVTWEKEVVVGAAGGRSTISCARRGSTGVTGLQGAFDTRGAERRRTLEVQKGGNSQFYLLDMGSCWKNDGRPCDGDVATDVTRYSEMIIINPDTPSWCTPSRVEECPPWHTVPERHARAPLRRARAAGDHAARAHPVWGEFGYPTEKGQGWVGDPREWELDVGAMSQALYFYQDPGTTPATRRWTSLDVGTEIYVSEHAEAEWTLSGFDILVPDTKRRRHGRKESPPVVAATSVGERSLF
ncbi:hypothetical protein PR202_ga11659 [Eleusine coracana subsp. coracana]|uniref:DUF7705 domain-containing protein n=1 Tax=Eleusine coracana subsp. coracana TaxID=191504 RepID=A0AAV5CA53_ELECO|nr:hypothetical protein PR202_ga11659 [Eleusine coracana subsp. coracana]